MPYVMVELYEHANTEQSFSLYLAAHQQRSISCLSFSQTHVSADPLPVDSASFSHSNQVQIFALFARISGHHRNVKQRNCRSWVSCHGSQARTSFAWTFGCLCCLCLSTLAYASMLSKLVYPCICSSQSLPWSRPHHWPDQASVRVHLFILEDL